MTQKIAIVTGASSGLGREIAKQLAADGYYVYATARRMELLESLRSKSIEPMQLDVTDDAMVEQVTQAVLQKHGHLDVLVNNAGFGYYSTIEDGTLKDIEYQFNVNYLGVVRMVKAVLPSMRERKAGLIINLASLVGQVSMPVLGYYASTKHALEAFSDALRMEVKQFGIKTVIIEPGVIKTGFEQVAFDTLHKSHKTNAYHKLVKTMEKSSHDLYAQAPGPELVAKAVHKAVTRSKPKRRYRVGRDAKLLITLRRMIGYVLLDRVFIKVMGASGD